jgi:hypothetical protein
MAALADDGSDGRIVERVHRTDVGAADLERAAGALMCSPGQREKGAG